MRKRLRVMGAMAMSLAAPQLASAQSSFIPPPPGTPVPPMNIPAHIAPAHIAPAPIERGDKPAGRKIVSTTNVQIDYRIDAFGPSGIGRVDIYMTPDRGTTWVKLGEDADKQSPANVNLPGEGLYGIRLAIVNGNGFGGRVPMPGDRPQLYVEVDATSPHVLLQPHGIVPNTGAIDIRWSAHDANLAAEPVSLFYRTNPASIWLPIAQNVKNDGSYRWAFPANIAGQVYLKLEVTDLAGNTTKVETPTPILLDQTEPEATLVDVTPIQRGQASPVVPLTAPSIPIPPAALPPATIPLNLPTSLPSLPSIPPLPE